MENKLTINSVLSDLKLLDAITETSDSLLNVYKIFQEDNSNSGIIVLKDGKFSGMLSRKRFFEIMSKQYMYDLFSKRTVDFFIATDTIDKYLVLHSSTSIISAANLALNRVESELSEPIVVQLENGRYKILDFYQLLLAQNVIQGLMNNLLQQANDFKQEVLAIVAHDLRNPIGNILGFSSLICDMDSDTSKAREFAGHISKTAVQMEDLVNSFLVSAINNSVEFDFVFSCFDIFELVSSIIRNFTPSLDRKQQNLRIECAANDYKICSDKIRLKEVFDNLISNAIKYSGTGKEIYIKLERESTYFTFIIKDQGPGFSHKDLQNIYGKFKRLSARPTANESSTGLGLFITKKIVDKLNGKINLESQEGIGSTFTVTLPITPG